MVINESAILKGSVCTHIVPMDYISCSSPSSCVKYSHEWIFITLQFFSKIQFANVSLPYWNYVWTSPLCPYRGSCITSCLPRLKSLYVQNLVRSSPVCTQPCVHVVLCLLPCFYDFAVLETFHVKAHVIVSFCSRFQYLEMGPTFSITLHQQERGTPLCDSQ